MAHLSVTSAEFQKGFGRFREAALKEPVTITNHGRDSLVLMAADEYKRLRRRERRVMGLADFSDEYSKPARYRSLSISVLKVNSFLPGLIHRVPAFS